jgi:hypothetical protein
VEGAIPVIRTYLERHAAEAVRPVPLARTLGLTDIRVVRGALATMAAQGELVSCEVIVGETRDHEYRLSAGRATFHYDHYVAPPKGPRRPDTRSIASRMTDIPANERPQAKAAPAPRATKEVPVDAAPVVAAEAPKIASAPVPVHRGNPNGKAPVLRQPILDFVLAQETRVTAAQVFRHINATRPVTMEAVCIVLKSLKDARVISRLADRVREPLSGGALVYAYTAPVPGLQLLGEEAAARVAEASEDAKGSDGETTPAVSPVPGEAALVAAAPREPELLPRKIVPAVVQRSQFEAQRRLDIFFRQCDGNWYGFTWLTRMAGGDVVATLETLAEWQREGRIQYAEADRSPIWRPVEGQW